jgi:hypothetical protein
MHKRLLTGELIAWYRSVVLLPIVTSIPLAGLAWWFMPTGLSRLAGLNYAAATGLIGIAIILFFTIRYSGKRIWLFNKDSGGEKND